MLAIHASPTIVTAPDPGDLSPLEGAIMDLCNELHALGGGRAGFAGEMVIERLDDALLRYERTDGEDHPAPQWGVPNQRALALSAAGRIEEAIDAETAALVHADTPRRLEISLGNIADRYLRLGRPADALAYFLDATEHAPESVPVMLTGLCAMARCGYLDEADRVARTIERCSPLAPGSQLAAHLAFDHDLRDLAPKLPSLAAMLERFEMSRAGGRGVRRG